MARALQNNPSLKSAQASLKAAYEQTKVAGAPLLPSISASFNPTRNKTSQALSPVPANNSYLYNLHTLQLNISYQPISGAACVVRSKIRQPRRRCSVFSLSPRRIR
ncbi:TolC family protein [Asaia platycodi]|uniref:TolC family protein n=1 Tax=Asaia platycodi TaxID=610243 RepID=UPI000B083DFA|nr:TolC family protein [Asaia platycodi]